MKRLPMFATLMVGCAAALLSVQTVVRADNPPNPQGVQFGQETSDLLINTLIAALVQEFDETTPQNVEQGKRSISLIFNDRNEDIRLVGVLEPLRTNDVPQDSFETTALANAMQGQAYTDVQKVEGKWYYRRSLPLPNFHPACAMCHTNFGPVTPGQWVGALMIRVPTGD